GLAVAVGVDERVLDLLLRVAVARVLEAPVPLGLLEDLAALFARVNGALDAWHSSDLLSLAEELRDLAHVLLGDLRVLAEAALALRRLLFQQVALHSATAQELARCRHFEPLLRSAVCLLLWHRLSSLPRSWSARAT